jgi:CheY-like chemotaxis protein
LKFFRKQSAAVPAAAEIPQPPAVAASVRRAEDKFLDALIMLVDDEPLCIEITRALLEEVGFKRFISTTDPMEAMAMLATTQPDVLLLDLMMPRMSGFELLERMESEGILRDVPTIVLTSATDRETKLKAMTLKVTEYLTKPVDSSELVLRVKNTLAAKAYWQGCWQAAAGAAETAPR